MAIRPVTETSAAATAGMLREAHRLAGLIMEDLGLEGWCSVALLAKGRPEMRVHPSVEGPAGTGASNIAAVVAAGGDASHWYGDPADQRHGELVIAGLRLLAYERREVRS